MNIPLPQSVVHHVLALIPFTYTLWVILSTLNHPDGKVWLVIWIPTIFYVLLDLIKLLKINISGTSVKIGKSKIENNSKNSMLNSLVISISITVSSIGSYFVSSVFVSLIGTLAWIYVIGDHHPPFALQLCTYLIGSIASLVAYRLMMEIIIRYSLELYKKLRERNRRVRPT